MTDKDRELFVKIYSEISDARRSCKLLLQTYFGDVRDVYEDIIKLPFDGVGLDFVEGKRVQSLLKNTDFQMISCYLPVL